MDYTVHGILQARILEWVAFPFSRVSSQSRDRTWVSYPAGRFFTKGRDQGRNSVGALGETRQALDLEKQVKTGGRLRRGSGLPLPDLGFTSVLLG